MSSPLLLTPAQAVFRLVFLLGPAGAALADEPGEESRWLRNVRQITRADMGLHKSGEGYFSPDGKRICFQAVPQGQTEYQIYVMDLEAQIPEMVSTGAGATTCAYFRPDGKGMLFASNHLDPRPATMPADVAAAANAAGQRNYRWSFFPGMDIYEYTFDTKALRPLVAAPGYDAEASYSPDGRLIVFTSMRDDDQEIYVANADGSDPRRITHAKGYDGGPFFSPDGAKIVYRSDRVGDGNMQIFINDLEGRSEKALTDNKTLHWAPYWHPTGKWLIYTRGDHHPDRRPDYDLYLLSVDTAETHRVTWDPAFDGLPVFSPDGARLMWTSKRGGLPEAQLFIADFLGLTRDGALRAK